MNRTVNITLLSWSVLLILIMPFVPYHHHNGMGCMVMEYCASDNTFNDEHTAHHADKDAKDNSLCVKNIQSLQAKSNVHSNWSDVLLFPLSATVYDNAFVEVCRQEEPLYDGYKISYRSPIGSRNSSLRAPPLFLS